MRKVHIKTLRLAWTCSSVISRSHVVKIPVDHNGDAKHPSASRAAFCVSGLEYPLGA